LAVGTRACPWAIELQGPRARHRPRFPARGRPGDESPFRDRHGCRSGRNRIKRSSTWKDGGNFGRARPLNRCNRPKPSPVFQLVERAA
jgi:hypothetical protein